MEESIIEFVLTTIQNLAAQYPDATWISIGMGVLLSICGVAAIATMWMPAPTQTTGAYAVIYRLVHALAAHFAQNKGAKADGSDPAVKSAVRQVTGK